MQEFEYKEQYKYLSNIMLCVTDACNLACRYCFVEQHPNYMTLETAIDAVEWAYNNLKIKKEKGWISEKEKASIFFFGGEPMLMFDSIIKPLIKYVKEKKYNIGFGMTTNGTLLTEERIKFLHDNKIGLLLSVDGFKETQDYNRPCQNGESSFDKIYNNIPILLKYYPWITFRSTIYEDTVEHCFENYLFAEKMGFKNYFCVPDVLTSKWEKNKLNILEEQIHKIFEYRLLQYSNNIKPMGFSRELNSLQGIKKICYDTPEFHYDPFIRCGLGIGLGAIGYDGNIYGCQEYACKGNSHKFYIGNIYTKGIDENKHIQLLQMYYDGTKKTSLNKKCNVKECLKYDICMKYEGQKLNCPAQNYHLFSTLDKKSEISCLYEQILFKESLAMFQTLYENNIKFFKEYILKI